MDSIPVVTNVLALLTPKSVPVRKAAAHTVRSAILEWLSPPLLFFLFFFKQNTVAEREKRKEDT